MNSVIQREATNDFDALQIADAMQRCEFVDVITIVFRSDPRLGERWHVYAKYDAEKISPKQIDAAVDDALGSD